ncbi:MAG: agmatinase family protein [Actinomycetota bacterium]|nr:agmatinase family protein [Actinomycetota bacterium]
MNHDDLSRVLVDGSLTISDDEHTSFRDSTPRGLASVDDADVVIVGAPFDVGTNKRYGTNEGPMAVRRGLSGLRSFSLELGVDIHEELKVVDIGNIDVTDFHGYEDTFRKLDGVLSWAYGAGKLPVVLGGDHSLAYRTIRSFAAAAEDPIGVIWIDNHFDCWPPFHGDPYFCGCPLRQVILDEPRVDASRVVHIGARGFSNSAVSARNAFELGFRWISCEEFRGLGVDAVVEECLAIAFKDVERVYMTVDIDVADVSFAPGTQTPRPGGLASWDLMSLVRKLSLAGCSGFDLVEVASKPDVEDFTALLGAEVVLEFLGGQAARAAGKGPATRA